MSDKDTRKEVEPVEVWEAPNRLEAQIVKGRLESEGIPAIITGEAAADIFGFATGEMAKASVLVPAPLAERAREILESGLDWVDAEWSDEDEMPDEYDGEADADRQENYPNAE